MLHTKPLLTAFFVAAVCATTIAQRKVYLDANEHVTKFDEASSYRQTQKVRMPDGAVRYRVEQRTLADIPMMTGYFRDKSLTVREGVFVYFNDHGIKVSQSEFRDGIPQGKAFQYYLNGAVSVEVYFQDGVPEGKTTGYYDDGRVLMEGSFKHGELDGLFTTYHPNGRISATKTFAAGKEHGETTVFYADGVVASKTVFSNGAIEGKTFAYHPDGRLFEDGNYADGKREGENLWYFPNGQLASKEFYSSDSLTSFELFNADGTRDLVSKTPNDPAEYPGGIKALYKWLSEHTFYPQDAVEWGIEGTVYIDFTIAADGKVEDPLVEQSVDPQLDAEALRVVRLMPAWKPAKIHGVVMATPYRLPVTFRLN